MLALQRNPEKLEAKALQYEQAGKTAKAIKYREKAVKIRQHKTATATGSTLPVSSQTTQGSGLPFMQRTPARYEQNALKWEQRGNWTKAQKNREKVWRMNNPQYANQSIGAPQFYQNNSFVGYNAPLTGLGVLPLNKGPILANTNTGLNTGFNTYSAGQTVLPATVETHVHNTIIEQTSRPERIVEVQPVIHREIDQTQVRVVEKHIYETVPSAGPHTITNAAIVQETVKPRIIEEIQPVVHRDVPAPFVERVEQHVTEHITKPTLMTKEVQQGGSFTTQPQQFVAAGGVPLQQTTTTTTTHQQGGIAGKVQNALHHNRA